MLEQHCDAELDDDAAYCGDYADNGWGVVPVCGWVGEARTPEVERIVKSMSMLLYHGPHYTSYDRFGHMMTSSRGFGTKKDAQPDMQRELKRGLTDVDAGPYTVLWWTSKGAYAKGTVVTVEGD